MTGVEIKCLVKIVDFSTEYKASPPPPPPPKKFLSILKEEINMKIISAKSHVEYFLEINMKIISA